MTNKNIAGSGRDDRDLTNEPNTPSQSLSSGGTLATDIGGQDKEKTALGGDPEPTGATTEDKVQPRIPTRSDHEGAAR